MVFGERGEIKKRKESGRRREEDGEIKFHKAENISSIGKTKRTFARRIIASINYYRRKRNIAVRRFKHFIGKKTRDVSSMIPGNGGKLKIGRAEMKLHSGISLSVDPSPRDEIYKKNLYTYSTVFENCFATTLRREKTNGQGREVLEIIFKSHLKKELNRSFVSRLEITNELTAWNENFDCIAVIGILHEKQK